MPGFTGNRLRQWALDFDDEPREADSGTGSRGWGGGYRPRRTGAAVLVTKLEVVAGSGVERAKHFPGALGWWRPDAASAVALAAAPRRVAAAHAGHEELCEPVSLVRVGMLDLYAVDEQSGCPGRPAPEGSA
jgi:hypothetical protein